MTCSDIDSLKLKLRDFAAERDWNQFHSPKNLSMALSVEVAELVEHFQWLTEEQSRNLPPNVLDEVSEELADRATFPTGLNQVTKDRESGRVAKCFELFCCVFKFHN